VQVNLPVIWAAVEELPVFRANQFLLQGEPSVSGDLAGVLMTVGYAAPPVLPGTPEEQAEAARSLGGIVPKTLARFSLGLDSAKQLSDLLLQHIARYEELQL